MLSFDYTSNGAYFLTICMRERECLLSEIAGDLTIVSDTGQIITDVWHELPVRFPTVSLDAFVVMPNHVHGILWLTDGPATDEPVGVGLAPPEIGRPAAGPRRPSLGQIVGAFKSLTTVTANKRHDTPGRSLWQRDYYERVVRNDAELRRFRQYIAENPARWAEDPENPAIRVSTEPGR